VVIDMAALTADAPGTASGPRLADAFTARTACPDGHGQARLEALTIQDAHTGLREQVPAAAVFIMIGAEPALDGFAALSS
jgi:hypothetical protein